MIEDIKPYNPDSKDKRRIAFMLRELRLLLQGLHDKFDQLLARPQVASDVTLADSEIQRLADAVKPLVSVSDADIQRIVSATVDALEGPASGSDTASQSSSTASSDSLSSTTNASQDDDGVKSSDTNGQIA